MAERAFTILRYVDKVPAMAGCAKCQLKFFTPHIYHNDPFGAGSICDGNSKSTAVTGEHLQLQNLGGQARDPMKQAVGCLVCQGLSQP